MFPFMVFLLSQGFEFRRLERFDLLEVVWILRNLGTFLENVHIFLKILIMSKGLNVIHELLQRNSFQRV